MTKRSTPPTRAGAALVSPEQLFAEEVGLVGERTGMPRTASRILGWLLICDPPNQSSAEIARALGVSRASVSIGTRLLEATGFVRRVVAPGTRSYRFEVVPDAFTSMRAEAAFNAWRELAERGLHLLGNPAGERGARLREMRDFYAFVGREVPKLIERFRAERGARTKRKERAR